MFFPERRSARSSAAAMDVTVSSMFTTTPRRNPCEGQVPTPTIFSFPSRSSSPTRTQIFVVPTSIPTITRSCTLYAPIGWYTHGTHYESCRWVGSAMCCILHLVLPRYCSTLLHPSPATFLHGGDTPMGVTLASEDPHPALFVPPDGPFLFNLVFPQPACGGPRGEEGRVGGHPRTPGHGTASPGTPCCALPRFCTRFKINYHSAAREKKRNSWGTPPTPARRTSSPWTP